VSAVAAGAARRGPIERGDGRGALTERPDGGVPRAGGIPPT
jgi:hypothetical protein